ncbi:MULTISPECIES: (deoxy)nucleoside triphosphate pyrophosphohydrolase [unclassified Pseudoclavibacter]|uniref:(deoxy)nucleoside triphosphate pyrophosphohydrolase n=1 Tax=unclassified Pseudoclavibacter TaxID=2615177 RepID=UPI000CE92CAD|nr:MULTISPECIES: (deoxy)nucleoside triphosphate pyrophosphohydrolase [unclassified Pseudoclavibacter]PPF40362.1 DNA mismatch repair protein MutT [Pseudoclavibacter sp. AY1H1]PPG02383.1 DNA mismatch repair protein MutT [Pseudoclavibacter sp. RFBI5]
MGHETTITVVAGVFLQDGNVLACRRGSDKSGAGSWEFPGGKVEPGETHEVALAREISEELSIQVNVLELVDRSRTTLQDVTIDLSCYFVEALETEPSSSTDHDLLRWVPISQLAALEWAKPDLPTVGALIRSVD